MSGDVPGGVIGHSWTCSSHGFGVCVSEPDVSIGDVPRSPSRLEFLRKRVGAKVHPNPPFITRTGRLQDFLLPSGASQTEPMTHVSEGSEARPEVGRSDGVRPED